MSLFNESMTERVTVSGLPVSGTETVLHVKEPVSVTEFVKNDIKFIFFAFSHGFVQEGEDVNLFDLNGDGDYNYSILRDEAERFLLQEGIPFVPREVAMV